MRSRTVIGVLALVCTVTLGITGTATAGSLSRAPLTVLSGPSPFAGCDISGQAGTNFLNSEVEPWVDVNPTDPSNVIAVWQQDRWSNGGARGLVTAVTHDGALTWDTTFAHFSTCSGGTAANGGNYERASDPWVSFAPTATPTRSACRSISSTTRQRRSWCASPATAETPGASPSPWPATPAGLRRSCSTTRSRSPPTPPTRALSTRCGTAADSPAIAPTSTRSTRSRSEATPCFARTTDAGATWEPARAIFMPKKNQFTIGHQIVVRRADVGKEQAWVQAVHVAADGTIAASCHDFRNNTPAAGAPTDHWLVHCHPSATTTCGDAGDWR